MVVPLLLACHWRCGARADVAGRRAGHRARDRQGHIEIETYPEEAPKTVAQVLALVKKGFYNGLRFHRAEPGFVIQIGDPQTRDMTKQAIVGHGQQRHADRRRRDHEEAASTCPARSAMAHSGSAKDADSQFYITLRAAPIVDGKYAVFGQVIKGMDVVDKIQKADVLKKASVRE